MENREIREVIASDHPENPIRVEINGQGFDVVSAEVDPYIGEVVLQIADAPFWRRRTE